MADAISAVTTKHCHMTLQAELEMEKFPIKDWLRSVPATELFDFMAAKLVALAERLGKRYFPQSSTLMCTVIYMYSNLRVQSFT